MSPRNTSTGAVLESMVLPALSKGGYSAQKWVNIGNRPAGRKHIVDVIATDAQGNETLVSMKWQQVSGTAEEKIPYEVICLLDAVRNGGGKYKKAYLVLGGIGWTLRDYYVSGALSTYINYGNLVKIVTLEQFVALANKGKL